MNPEQKDLWLRHYGEGEASFIIHFGVLKVGILFTLFVFSTEYLEKYGLSFSDLSLYVKEKWVFILFRAIVFGALFGYVTWKRNEGKFNRL